MSPAYRENPPLSSLYAQRAGTEGNNLSDSTLEAYEVEELSESDLGRYLAEIVMEQLTTGDRQPVDRVEAVVENIYRREIAKLS